MATFKNIWHCIRCDKEMENVVGVIQPHDGTVFLGSPGYGSMLDMDHRDIDEVSEYAIALCDDCMTNNRALMRGIKEEVAKRWDERITIVELEPDRIRQQAKKFKDTSFLEKNIKEMEETYAKAENKEEVISIKKRIDYSRLILDMVLKFKQENEKKVRE